MVEVNKNCLFLVTQAYLDEWKSFCSKCEHGKRHDGPPFDFWPKCSLMSDDTLQMPYPCSQRRGEKILIWCKRFTQRVYFETLRYMMKEEASHV